MMMEGLPVVVVWFIHLRIPLAPISFYVLPAPKYGAGTTVVSVYVCCRQEYPACLASGASHGTGAGRLVRTVSTSSHLVLVLGLFSGNPKERKLSA
jgi:hypothetical protein